MKYYAKVISKDIYNKLIDAGMPQLLETYAQVFDWIIGQGIFISVAHAKVEGRDVCWYPIVNGKHPQAIDGRDWEHSAILAIEKALELIKEK